jgi:hypothetical protein
MANIQQIDYGSGQADGAVLGGDTTAKIGFFGATPVARRTAATQSTLAAYTLTTGGVGFVTTAQLQSVLDQLNEVRALLTQYGLWKGS